MFDSRSSWLLVMLLFACLVGSFVIQFRSMETADEMTGQVVDLQDQLHTTSTRLIQTQDIRHENRELKNQVGQLEETISGLEELNDILIDRATRLNLENVDLARRIEEGVAQPTPIEEVDSATANSLAALPDRITPKEIIEKYPDLSSLLISAPDFQDKYLLEGASKPDPREMILEIGMVLDVDVTNVDNLRAYHTIDENGQINMPLAGTVDAAGMSIPDLEQTLTILLSPYLATPVVDVRPVGVDENTPAVVEVIRANEATEVPWTEGMTLLNLLDESMVASKFEDSAMIHVIKPEGGDEATPLVVLSDPWRWLMRGEIAQNVPLGPGDVIYIADGNDSTEALSKALEGIDSITPDHPLWSEK